MPRDFAKTLLNQSSYANNPAPHHGIDTNGERLDGDCVRHAVELHLESLPRPGQAGKFQMDSNNCQKSGGTSRR